jgi:transcriptional regulator with XRE-family HTH domain
MDLFTSTDLARMAKEERIKRNLTQEQVAEAISKRPDTGSCSKQVVSHAENSNIGSRLDGLRIKIIESLTGHRLKGPVWYFDERTLTHTPKP